MAVVPLCYKMPFKDLNLSNGRERHRGLINGCCLEGDTYFSSITNSSCRRWRSSSLTSINSTEVEQERKFKLGEGFSKRCLDVQAVPGLSIAGNRLRMVSRTVLPKDNLYMIGCSSESENNKRQIRSLDSYFGKLQGVVEKEECIVLDKATDLLDRTPEGNTKKGLSALDVYLGKLNKDSNPEDSTQVSTSVNQSNERSLVSTPFSVNEDTSSGEDSRLGSYTRFIHKDVETASRRTLASWEQDGTSDLYLIGLLASINIAVFLFEIASPVRSSDLGLFSLPSLYGAKINHLILDGEWWRLVTPMFLHSGIFHVALGCWALVTFGPRVCRAYGSFTFLLIYVLGGISGNLTSFLHTPDPTVGGTGPVFAIIGAWLIYQIQNKAVIEKDVAEKMFQKAVIATTLSCMLSNFGPIDDWTHLGAIFTGIVYGFLTCPRVQLDEASQSTGQEEQITLVRSDASPCKSLVVFTVFTMVLTSLLLFAEPPLDPLELENFL